jgi:hypothetical protein
VRAAEELLAELGISDPADIELEAIAHCVGVEVQYRRLASCEAQIIGYKDRAVVYVSPDTSGRDSARGMSWGTGITTAADPSSAAHQTSDSQSTRNQETPSGKPMPIRAT